MKFFFNNYKAMFHICGIAITFGIFLLAGFKADMANPLFDIFALVIAYFTSNFSLKMSGLDELAKQYYKEQKEKSEN